MYIFQSKRYYTTLIHGHNSSCFKSSSKRSTVRFYSMILAFFLNGNWEFKSLICWTLTNLGKSCILPILPIKRHRIPFESHNMSHFEPNYFQKSPNLHFLLNKTSWKSIKICYIFTALCNWKKWPSLLCHIHKKVRILLRRTTRFKSL